MHHLWWRARNIQNEASLDWVGLPGSQHQKWPPGDVAFGTLGPAATSSASASNTQQPATGTKPAQAAYKPSTKAAGKRVGKCRNFPQCGDGEHWDRECPLPHKTGTSAKTTRSYYVEQLDPYDADKPLEVQELDLIDAVENEYTACQDSFFADAFFAEKKAHFVHPSSQSEKKTIPPKHSQCKVCGKAFDSRNRLHKHLESAQHKIRRASLTNGALPAPQASTQHVIVESTATGKRQANPLQGFSDYHYATANFQLEPNGVTYSACVDSGYGNSAINEDFLFSLPAEHQGKLYTLDKPSRVGGVGGGSMIATEAVEMGMVMRSDDGRFAHIPCILHIFKNPSTPVLLGSDTLHPCKIDLLYSRKKPKMRIDTCEGIEIPVTIHTGQHIKKETVRVARQTLVPPGATVILPIAFAPVPANQTYIFSPSAQIGRAHV